MGAMLCSSASIAQDAAGETPQAPTTGSQLASTQQQEPASAFGDIVVTATRREARLQDVPVAVTAITGAGLAAADVSTLRTLTQVVPGFIGSRNMGVFQPVIRGVGSTGISIGDEPNIATYVDGVYQPESAANWIDLVEVERVEVLRGPQGTTFGRNATGGLINVITPDPSFDFRGKASVRVGRMRNDAGDYDARMYVTGPISETAALDFASLFRKNDGYIKDLVRGGTLGGQRVIDLRSKLLLKPADNVKVVLTGEFFDQQSTTNAPQPIDGNTLGRAFPGVILPRGPWEASLTRVPVLDLRRWTAALHVSVDLETVNLESTSGFLNLRWYQETDSDASNVDIGNFPALFATESGSSELKLSSTNAGPFQWLVGGYFYQFGGHADLSPFATTTPPSPLVGPHLQPELSGRSFAGFGEGTYELSGGLFVTLGGRYTTEKRSFTQILNGNTVANDVSKTFNKFNYKVGVRYEITSRTNVYATHSTAFKSGVYNMAATLSTPVLPEEITAYEVGLKTDPLPWLRINIATYYYDYKNLQLQARAANSSAYILQNAGNAEIYGGELETFISPVDGLKLRAAVAYTHARYQDFTAAQGFIPRGSGGNIVATTDASGNVMTRAPKWSGNFGADYTTAMGGGTFGAGANLSWSSRVYYDFLNIFSQPSYTLTNASIFWTPDSQAWKASLWVTNLTNEKVFQTIRPGAFSTDGFYEQPRKIGASFEVRF
ncbi:TonB-dependent receptor [Sphingobium terrigena]|uniref:TonB-dependent receptor n=2 Tax=Sphingobium terrigena TaxID=2304063 RepID=A0A418YP66_9SPHN|nr:TonB-dependent receptor [Sphingobium terrigena]